MNIVIERWQVNTIFSMVVVFLLGYMIYTNTFEMWVIGGFGLLILGFLLSLINMKEVGKGGKK